MSLSSNNMDDFDMFLEDQRARVKMILDRLTTRYKKKLELYCSSPYQIEVRGHCGSDVHVLPRDV